MPLKSLISMEIFTSGFSRRPMTRCAYRPPFFSTLSALLVKRCSMNIIWVWCVRARTLSPSTLVFVTCDHRGCRKSDLGTAGRECGFSNFDWMIIVRGVNEIWNSYRDFSIVYVSCSHRSPTEHFASNMEYWTRSDEKSNDADAFREICDSPSRM